LILILIYFALLCFALLCFALLCFALLCFVWWMNGRGLVFCSFFVDWLMDWFLMDWFSEIGLILSLIQSPIDEMY
jgi:hypothetical protein